MVTQSPSRFEFKFEGSAAACKLEVSFPAFSVAVVERICTAVAQSPPLIVPVSRPVYVSTRYAGVRELECRARAGGCISPAFNDFIKQD